MILRTWHGRTRLEDADSYERFMRERAAPDYGSVPGLVRAVFTRRDEEQAAHFLLVTVWDSMDSVRKFAGGDPARAKYYPEDEAFLLERETEALNHRVFFDSDQ